MNETDRSEALLFGLFCLSGLIGVIATPIVIVTAGLVVIADAEVDNSLKSNRKSLVGLARTTGTSAALGIGIAFTTAAMLCSSDDKNEWLDRPSACKGCQHYHGRRYKGEQLVCGMHPYGPGDQPNPAKWSKTCPDWEGRSST
ncbi:MAG: hypothetical protein LDL41_22625 [Coleofasciculus sp. S288]|nr:hypothetical protein [Coleofasciculus sp. S288]